MNSCFFVFFAEPFTSADVVGVWGDSVSTPGSSLPSAPTISSNHPCSVPCCHQGHTRPGFNSLPQVPAQLHLLQVWIRGSWDRSRHLMKKETLNKRTELSIVSFLAECSRASVWFHCFKITFFISFFFFLLPPFKDLLSDDCECDWPADELPGDNPWLLVGSHRGEAPAGSYCQDLAKILSLPVHLHDLPVYTVCGHATCSLYRWVLISTYVQLDDNGMIL